MLRAICLGTQGFLYAPAFHGTYHLQAHILDVRTSCLEAVEISTWYFRKHAHATAEPGHVTSKKSGVVQQYEIAAHLAVVGCRVWRVVARGQETPPVDEGQHEGARRRQQPQQEQKSCPNLRTGIEDQCLALFCSTTSWLKKGRPEVYGKHRRYRKLFLCNKAIL